MRLRGLRHLARMGEDRTAFKVATSRPGGDQSGEQSVGVYVRGSRRIDRSGGQEGKMARFGSLWS